MQDVNERISSWAGLPNGLHVVDEPDAEPQAPDAGPFCPRCRGFRFLKPAEYDPRGSTDSQLVVCPECRDLTRARRMASLAKAAGLSNEQRTKTFARLSPIRAMTNAVNLCKTWAANPDGWLVVYGRPGSGKTHLSLAAANSLIERGVPVSWWYAEEIIARCRLIIEQGEAAPLKVEQFLQGLKQAPVLFIDDLGAMRPTEYAIGVMEALADYRYRERLATCWTCIGSPEEVKQALSESIGRRMQDPSVCRVAHNAAGQFAAPPA